MQQKGAVARGHCSTPPLCKRCKHGIIVGIAALRQRHAASLQCVSLRYPSPASLAPLHRLSASNPSLPSPAATRTGFYSYFVSVPGASPCVASFTVQPCPPPTLTCAPARVVALTYATSCAIIALPLSSFYNVTAPGDIPPVVTVNPPLPSDLTFGAGKPGSGVCLVLRSRWCRLPARLWPRRCHIAAGCPHPASPLCKKSTRRTAPALATPEHRLLHVHRVCPGWQLVHHVAQRYGLPLPHGDVRTGEGGGPDSGYLVLQCKPSGVVLLQRHTAGGYPPCRDSQPTAAARLDFWAG